MGLWAWKSIVELGELVELVIWQDVAIADVMCSVGLNLSNQ